MPRQRLDDVHVSERAQQRMTRFYARTVEEVRQAVDHNPVVVVGMAWNKYVRRARRTLTRERIPHLYLEYGNYLFGWYRRLAIKLWSGWPTFPQVFVGGVLIGGAYELNQGLHDGSIRALLESVITSPDTYESV